MTEKDVISYWLTTATEDLQTAQDLVGLKRYHHALFFCHLAIEKILKGLIFTKTHTHSLPIHDLIKLAKLAGLSLTEDKEKKLSEMTTWNIQARYDSIKRKFYKKATASFTKEWFAKTKEIFLWAKNHY